MVRTSAGASPVPFRMTAMELRDPLVSVRNDQLPFAVTTAHGWPGTRSSVVRILGSGSADALDTRQPGGDSATVLLLPLPLLLLRVSPWVPPARPSTAAQPATRAPGDRHQGRAGCAGRSPPCAGGLAEALHPGRPAPTGPPPAAPAPAVPAPAVPARAEPPPAPGAVPGRSTSRGRLAERAASVAGRGGSASAAAGSAWLAARIPERPAAVWPGPGTGVAGPVSAWPGASVAGPRNGAVRSSPVVSPVPSPVSVMSPVPSPHAPRSAAAKSRHVWYLSSGDLASAFASTWSTAGGRSPRRAVSAGGGSDSWAHSTASRWSRLNGGEPDSISNVAQASA